MLTKQKFEKYHEENPFVYEMFSKFTFQAIDSGRSNFGAHAINERLRWYSQIETIGDQFKLNNNYVPFYARLFEKNFPEHKGFFRKRRSIADSKG